jgi:hypothetical protein
MFPSGVWQGFWVQASFGRQPMEGFRLDFRNGLITGQGRDVVGRFTFAGRYDERTGHVRMVKRYAAHQVEYDGMPDGEGSIAGTWRIGDAYSGPFLLRPSLPRPRGDEPIQEIRK